MSRYLPCLRDHLAANRTSHLQGKHCYHDTVLEFTYIIDHLLYYDSGGFSSAAFLPLLSGYGDGGDGGVATLRGNANVGVGSSR